jgi:hypothetical protein
MRFTEIINPEDQLALWRLISDKVWSAFGQTAPQPSVAAAQHPVAPATPKPAAKGLSRVSAKPMRKGRATPAKKGKPKRAPMAPPPKPLPKPKPLQPTQIQTKQAQTQQHQQLAHHIQQALTKKPPGPSQPQATQPSQNKGVVTNPVAPMNNSYNERDKDELVFHKRQNPLKPLRDQNPL